MPSEAVSLPQTTAPQAPTPVKQARGDVCPSTEGPVSMRLPTVEQGLPSPVFLPAPWSLCVCLCAPTGCSLCWCQ